MTIVETTDFTKLRVDDLRTILVQEYNLPVEEVDAIKGKSALVEKVQELEGEALLNDVESVEDVGADDVPQEATDPINIRNTPEWTEFVMSHLEEDEKVGDYPTVDGLRRVCEIVYGEITQSRTEVIQVPTEENDRRATVRVCLTIYKHGSMPIEVDGAADVCWRNTPKPFYKHPVATAETRAEGRALRRALKIRTLTAEEMMEGSEEEPGTTDEDGLAKAEQLTFLDVICKTKHKINVVKLLRLHFGEDVNIKKLTYKQLADLFVELNKYQTENEVPDELIGYEPNWKEEVGG